MITELGKYIGYQSHADRELFKAQIRRELGGESIAEMTTVEQIRIKIEELHQLAGAHYNFIFSSNDPDICRIGEQSIRQPKNDQ